jgi:hypothetical protein
MRSAAAAGVAPKKSVYREREKNMSIRVRFFAVSATIASLAALALVAGGDWFS